MVFRAFDGRLMLTLHQPNATPDERMALFEVEDTDATLRIKAPLNQHVSILASSRSKGHPYRAHWER